VDEFLSVSGLCKSFGGLKAVDSVSFSMERGSIHAVIGPNGAGKTTLFNLISGSARPDSGKVGYRGADITALPPFKIAQRGILRTFQAVRLSPRMSALENVMLGMYAKTRSGPLAGMLALPSSRREERESRDRALAVLAEFGLEGQAGLPAASLSFGSQRMVELARCLAGRPELILLDEPASGLNMSETRDLTERIGRLKTAGLSVLLVEHDMSLVMEISDRLTVLNFGKKIAEGTPKQIQADPDVIRVYLGEDDA
jgi:branched-chain amino acid transport system ATP-binding protein